MKQQRGSTASPKPHMRSREEIDEMQGVEVEEKRTEMAKLYSLGEDIFQAVLFEEPVHYLDKKTGKWEDIDNELVEEETQHSRCLRNRRNGKLSAYMHQAADEWLVRLENEMGDEIAWRLDVPQQRVRSASDGNRMRKLPVRARADDRRSKYCASRAKQTIERNSGKAVYEGILPGVDMHCSVDGTHFKEDVIFHTREVAGPVSFILSAPSLTLTMQADNSIIAQNAKGEDAFYLPAPVIFDANEQEGLVSVSLSPCGKDTWTLRYNLDAEWLDRAFYPVTLDPVVYTNGSDKVNRKVNVVDSSLPDRVIPGSFDYQFLISHTPSKGSQRMAFLKFTDQFLPPIDSSYVVTNAEYQCSMSGATNYIFAREVLEDYDPATLTYNTMPSIGDVDIDSHKLPALASDATTTFVGCTLNITRLVRKWYEGNNKGVVIQTRSPNSAEKKSTGNGGMIVVTYTSKAGLESHMEYESHTLGRAGTAHVNLFNGNLVFAHSDTASGGKRMPVSLTHYFNACEKHLDQFKLGKGWRHSMLETVHKEMLATLAAAQGRTYETVVYTRGDGSKAYFRKTGSVLNDLSGTFMKGTVTGTPQVAKMTQTRTDMQSEFLYPQAFSSSRGENFTVLRSITDVLGNKVTVTSTSPTAITKITDGAGRDTLLTYATDGRLTQVKGPADTNGVQYAYDENGYLTSITHDDGEVTHYAYNEQGLLSKATNQDGRYLEIEYTETTPHRVTRVLERNGEMVGNCRIYTYGDGMTTVTDGTIPDGKSLHYHFNDNGNVVAANDMLGHASIIRYQADYPPNHPESISKMQRVVTNLLRNHRFESSTDWVMSGSVAYATAEAYYGSRYMRILAQDNGAVHRLSQSVSLEKGQEYTLSCYAKRTGMLDVWSEHTYVDSAGVPQTQRGHSQKMEAIDGEYRRIAYTFTLPEDAASESVEVSFCVKGESSTQAILRIDAAQLEMGPVPNSYNLLINSDFAFNSGGVPYGWIAQTGNTAEDKVRTDVGEGKPDGLSRNALRLHGGMGKVTGIYQDVMVSGVKGDIVVLGGWAKTLTAAHRDKKKDCSLRIVFYNGSAQSPVQQEIKWSETWSGWQFACGPISNSSVKFDRIRVYLDYTDNINWADFGGLMLYKEEFGWSYVYDTNGKVTSTRNLAGQYRNAQYDSYGNMTLYQHWGQPASVTTKLEYGTVAAQQKKRLVQKITSPMLTSQSFTYDSAGNCTETKVQKGTLAPFMLSKTTYTADLNHVASRTDGRNNTVLQSIHPQKDVLESVTDPEGHVVRYSYDESRRIRETAITVDEGRYANEYAYTQDRLTEVRHNTSDTPAEDVCYSFAFDELGFGTDVSVGDCQLSRNVYADDGSHQLQRLEYGNGDEVTYMRDDFKRLTAVHYDGESEPSYTYSYDAAGNAAKVDDHILGRVRTVTHDMAGRPMRITEKDAGGLLYASDAHYDGGNNLSKAREWINEDLYETAFTYNKDQCIDTIAYNRKGVNVGKVTVAYDGLGRIVSRARTPAFTTTYQYMAGGHGSGSTTSIVTSITQPGQAFSYVYNRAGQIISESRNQVATTYRYDPLGQLIRVNDEAAGTTELFSYDLGGNFLSRSCYPYTEAETPSGDVNTVTYAYADANWRDKLTHFGGIPIDYDAIGNPLQDGKWTYTWQAGRQLKQMASSDETVRYHYNADGLRVQKVSSSRGTTDYTLSGTKVVHQKRGEEEMHFWYDDSGMPSTVWYNGATYLYVHNLQGDVVALVDRATGLECVTYRYDAWGKLFECTGSMADTLGRENPFRYRGYVFDVETGFYYLQSRYYNPTWGRFINTDIVLGSPGQLVTHNAFTYCHNNPINLHDPSGMAPQWDDPWYIAAMEAHGRRQLAEIAMRNKTIGLLNSKGVYGLGLKSQTATLTDLETGKSFNIWWQPNHPREGGYYHSEWAVMNDADLRIVEKILNKDEGERLSWDWTARSGVLTFNNGLSIGVGFHLTAHEGALDKGLDVPGTDREGNEISGHMCMYYGDSLGGGEKTGPKLNNAVNKVSDYF